MQNIQTKPQTAVWWTIFRDLRDARSVLGLSAPHLNTLAALLSFLKPDDPDMMVFAANKTILERLNGLCERSFQRHITALVERGLIRRHDSANRKRFRFQGKIAYGFDLTPLLAHREAIAEMARQTRDAAVTRKALRHHILEALAQLQRLGHGYDDEENARRLLRRNVPNVVFAELLTTLETCLQTAESSSAMTPQPHVDAEDMSAKDSQNVGHYQKTFTKVSSDQSEITKDTFADMSQCAEKPTMPFKALHHKPSQHDIASWLGISAVNYATSIARHGQVKVGKLLTHLLDRLDEIKNPAGYFYTSLLRQTSICRPRFGADADVIRG